MAVWQEPKMTLIQKLTAIKDAIQAILADVAALETALTDLSTFLDPV